MNDDDSRKIINDWEDTMLKWYGDADEVKGQTMEAINEEWRACFMDDAQPESRIIDRWEDAVLEWYGDANREVKMQTLEAMNEEWCACFITDHHNRGILNVAA